MKKCTKPSICFACFKPIEVGMNLVKHHVSYYPELIVPVHSKCHSQIHRSGLYPHLEPDYRQSLRHSRKISNSIKTHYTYCWPHEFLEFMYSMENGFWQEDENGDFPEDKRRRWFCTWDYWEDYHKPLEITVQFQF